MRHNRIKNYVDSKNTYSVQKMELVIGGGDSDDDKEKQPFSPLVRECMNMLSMNVALLRILAA
jgi:hypothetical protein